MKDIQAGDIIAIEEPAYVEFEGGLYSDHFVMKKRYYMAIESQRNNGDFKAVNSKGIMRWINESEVIERRCNND